MNVKCRLKKVCTFLLFTIDKFGTNVIEYRQLIKQIIYRRHAVLVACRKMRKIMINSVKYLNNKAFADIFAQIVNASEGALTDEEVKSLTETVRDNWWIGFAPSAIKITTDPNEMLGNMSIASYIYDDEDVDPDNWDEHQQMYEEYGGDTIHCSFVWTADGSKCTVGLDEYDAVFDPNVKTAILVFRQDAYDTSKKVVHFCIYVPSKKSQWEYTDLQKTILEALKMEM